MMGWPKQQAYSTPTQESLVTQDEYPDSQSGKPTLEEAVEQGPLPGDTEPADDERPTREDYERSEGLVPEADRPGADGTVPATEGSSDPDQREREVAGDETVGGIFQPGGRGG
jgi:hypothetical protein